MKIDFEVVKSGAVVRLDGALVADNSDGLVSRLRAHFQQHKLPVYVLDFSALTQLDSTGIGALVTCLRHLRTAGSDLKLASVGGRALITLQVARADRLFEFHPTTAAALAAK